MAILYAMKWPIFVRPLRDAEGWTSAKDFDDGPGGVWWLRKRFVNVMLPSSTRINSSHSRPSQSR